MTYSESLRKLAEYEALLYSLTNYNIVITNDTNASSLLLLNDKWYLFSAQDELLAVYDNFIDAITELRKN